MFDFGKASTLEEKKGASLTEFATKSNELGVNVTK